MKTFFSFLMLLAVIVGSLGVPTPGAQAQAVTPILRGSLDGVVFDGERAFVVGWACLEGNAPITVNVYHTAAPPSPASVPVVGATAANLTSEDAVRALCKTSYNRWL